MLARHKNALVPSKAIVMAMRLVPGELLFDYRESFADIYCELLVASRWQEMTEILFNVQVMICVVTLLKSMFSLALHIMRPV